MAESDLLHDVMTLSFRRWLGEPSWRITEYAVVAIIGAGMIAMAQPSRAAEPTAPPIRTVVPNDAYRLGTWLHVKDIPSGVLGDGWSGLESWGLWNDGHAASINFEMDDDAARAADLVFEFVGAGLVSPDHPVQRVDVTVNGRKAGVVTITKRGFETYDIKIPADKRLKIELSFPDAISPPNDARKLALGLVDLRVKAAGTD